MTGSKTEPGVPTLTLTGPARGRFAAPGEVPEQIELDAVEFCRIVSGRSTGAGR